MLSFLEGPELLILIVAVLVLFGGSQIPKLAKNLGRAQAEFKKALEHGPATTGETSPDEETVEQKLARLEEIDKRRLGEPREE